MGVKLIDVDGLDFPDIFVAEIGNPILFSHPPPFILPFCAGTIEFQPIPTQFIKTPLFHLIYPPFLYLETPTFTYNTLNFTLLYLTLPPHKCRILQPRIEYFLIPKRSRNFFLLSLYNFFMKAGNREKGEQAMKVLVVLAVLLLFPILSLAQSQTVESECSPFATSQWVLTNQQTGEVGVVVDISFNPPRTCQFEVRYPDGSPDYKVVLGVSEREKMRAERLNKIENPQREEVKSE